MKILRAFRYVFRRIVVAQVNFLATPFAFGPVDRVRNGLLRLLGTRIGAGSFVSSHFFVFDGRNLRIGGGGNLGAFARIWDFYPIEIGDGLLASHGLTIVSGTHETRPPYRSVPGPVSIGRGVWIGVNVTIVGPCDICDGAVIGANAFVTGTLATPGIYAGSPARLKRAL